MTVKATLCKGRDLKAGDLFSTVGQGYWSTIDLTGSVGECVYIRTNTPADNFEDADEDIFRVEVIR